MPPNFPHLDFATRLIDAMTVAGHGANAASWSRIPVEIEPLRREAGAKSLTTARKYLEGLAFPRRHRLERIAEWLGVTVVYWIWPAPRSGARGCVLRSPG